MLEEATAPEKQEESTALPQAAETTAGQISTGEISGGELLLSADLGTVPFIGAEGGTLGSTSDGDGCPTSPTQNTPSTDINPSDIAVDASEGDVPPESSLGTPQIGITGPASTVANDPNKFEEWIKNYSTKDPKVKERMRELRALGVPQSDIYSSYVAGEDNAINRMYSRFARAAGARSNETLSEAWKRQRFTDAPKSPSGAVKIELGEIFYEYENSYYLYRNLLDFYNNDLNRSQRETGNIPRRIETVRSIISDEDTIPVEERKWRDVTR